MSKSCLTQFPTNSPRKFRNKLCNPMCLEGEWQVALEDLSFPFQCTNLTQSINILFIAPCFPTKSHDADVFHSPASSLESTPIERTPNRLSRTTIERVSRSGLLQRGYYRNADELGSAMMSLFHDLFKEQRDSGDLILDLDYDFFETDNTFKFVAIPLMEHGSLEIQTLSIVSSDWVPFRSYLGLDNIISADGIQLNPDTEMRPAACNVPNFRRLYVCSDVIEYQNVAGSSTQLLASLPIDHNGRCEFKILPRYLTVRGISIETIEIELMSNIQTREIFPIPRNPSDYDYVECTLHFRRKSMLQSCI